MKRLEPKLGPTLLGEGRCRFCVWAPFTNSVEVHLLSPQERMEPLVRDRHGCHWGVLDGVEPGALYRFRLDGSRERPDPASRFQPQGVHGPSQVVNAAFGWTDGNWRGLPLQRYVLYELHAGTFTAPGTFDAGIERLDDLEALGITAVEIMPAAQFPGERNWGYDLISRLPDIRRGDCLRSGRMRMEDCEQVQPLWVDPLECLELFIRIHQKSHRTLSLVPHGNHLLHLQVFSGEQAACFQWSMAGDMLQYFIVLRLINQKPINHLSG